MYPSAEDVASDRPAVVMAGSGDVLTYAELQRRSNQLAHLFRDQGLRTGDHVAMLMDNALGLVVALSAAERSGLYFTTVDPRYTNDEVAWIIGDSTARVVIVSAAMGPRASELIALCPAVERWLYDGPGTPPRGFEHVAEATASCPVEPIADERLGLAMLYSSGTTGRPKGILRPLPDASPQQQIPLYLAVIDLYRMRRGQVAIEPGPMYHGAPQTLLALTIRLGGTAVLMERFDPEKLLQSIETYGGTHAFVVPTMMSRMLALPSEVRDRYDVGSMEVMMTSAAPCPISVKEGMIGWFGPVVYEVYGASEGNGLTVCTPQQALAKPGSVGTALFGELLIRGEEGETLSTGEVGEVWFRGATAFEYFHDAEKTRKNKDDDGTASATGDIGYVDEDGYLFLTDRIAFTVISGGRNVYPQEIENLLADHPDVADVAVVGVPDDDLGEVVKAVVQLRPGITAGAEEEARLIAACEGRLAKYKWPRSVDFVDEVERTPTGKLNKRALRDRYWSGRSARI
jgi:long-chain acyl-CoA synthetase